MVKSKPSRVLLISTQSNTDTIGLKYLHSYLSANNVDSIVLFIPSFNEKKLKSLHSFLLNLKPEIIGFSLMSHEFNNCRTITQYIKKHFPEIKIVWGGIHPTINPEESLRYADYVFIGESEIPFLDLVNQLKAGESLKDVGSLVYLDHGRIIQNKLTSLNENLNELPFPEHLPNKSYMLLKNVVRLTKNLFKKYSRYSGTFYSLVTSRGCPFFCTYCCNSFLLKLYKKNSMRKRSVDNVIAELKIAIGDFPELFYINIEDDCFLGYDIGWIRKFAEEYKEKIRRSFICRTTPVHITEEKITLLRKAGLSCISMGLQSGSERTNKEVYKRFFSNSKFIEAAKIVHKYKLMGWYDVILDNPYEDDSDLLKTLDVILRIPRPFQLSLYSLYLHKGMELYGRAKKDSIKIQDPSRKNYLKYKPTYLNKLIRISPLYFSFFIRFMARNRNSLLNKSLLKIIYYPSIIILEPFLWFRLILISFDFDIFKTFKLGLLFLRTGFNRMILRKSE